MKLLVVPALSALLFAGLPAQAQTLHQLPFQLAENSFSGSLVQQTHQKVDRASIR